MSQNDQVASFLYDFLYINTDKINSYYSQLDKAGLLKSMKISKSYTDGEIKKFAAGVKGFAEYDSSQNESDSKSMEQFFDASQSIPLQTIAALNEAGLIKTDIHNAAYGQLILVSGSAEIVDLEMFQGVWDIIVKIAHEQTTPPPKNNSKQAKRRASILPDEFVAASKMLETIPRMVGFKVYGEDYRVWSSLQPEYLIGSSFDLGLKHGTSIRGTWHALGVLDAKPGDHECDVLSSNAMVEAYHGMFDGLRGLIGRTNDEFGFMPLVIWRKIE